VLLVSGKEAGRMCYRHQIRNFKMESTAAPLGVLEVKEGIRNET
jgi:hypothetical protein